MKIETRIKHSFSVIGKEGSTAAGQGFISALWTDVNTHWDEILPLAKKDKDGVPVGIWGAMSDFSRSFDPWEDEFQKGLYLAGLECADGARAPEGFTKWRIPSYEYICAEVESSNTFSQILSYMEANRIPLVGAVHDFTCPKSGKSYMLFPIRKL